MGPTGTHGPPGAPGVVGMKVSYIGCSGTQFQMVAKLCMMLLIREMKVLKGIVETMALMEKKC